MGLWVLGPHPQPRCPANTLLSPELPLRQDTQPPCVWDAESWFPEGGAPGQGLQASCHVQLWCLVGACACVRPPASPMGQFCLHRPEPTCREAWPVPGEAWAPARLARGGGLGTSSKALGLKPWRPRPFKGAVGGGRVEAVWFSCRERNLAQEAIVPTQWARLGLARAGTPDWWDLPLTSALPLTLATTLTLIHR